MKNSPFRWMMYILIGLSLLWVDIIRFPLLVIILGEENVKVKSLFKWWFDLKEGE
jgi:hypothetical protein